MLHINSKQFCCLQRPAYKMESFMNDQHLVTGCQHTSRIKKWSQDTCLRQYNVQNSCIWCILCHAVTARRLISVAHLIPEAQCWAPVTKALCHHTAPLLKKQQHSKGSIKGTSPAPAVACLLPACLPLPLCCSTHMHLHKNAYRTPTRSQLFLLLLLPPATVLHTFLPSS